MLVRLSNFKAISATLLEVPGRILDLLEPETASNIDVGLQYSGDRFALGVADLLAREQVVGWFQGRMEFGPRALGARSILGDARSRDMQSVMNRKIKFRESFRPFAPSVLRERVDDYFEMRPEEDSPYMLLVAPVRDRHRVPLDAGSNGLRPHLYREETLRRASGRYVDVMRRYFMTKANRIGYETIDMQPVFLAHYETHGERFEWPQDSHWNALGHEMCFDVASRSDLLTRGIPG